jgi:hypothetical protein
VRRAIDIHEGDKVDVAALKDLIRAAVALNLKGLDLKDRGKPKRRRASSKRADCRIAGPGHISSPREELCHLLIRQSARY